MVEQPVITEAQLLAALPRQVAVMAAQTLRVLLVLQTRAAAAVALLETVVRLVVLADRVSSSFATSAHKKEQAAQ